MYVHGPFCGQQVSVLYTGAGGAQASLQLEKRPFSSCTQTPVAQEYFKGGGGGMNPHGILVPWHTEGVSHVLQYDPAGQDMFFYS
jgi:hypothetical protein